MSQEDDYLIPVTPSHSITVANGIQGLIEAPQERDFVIRNLMNKTANGQPLIQGELVVSGKQTREAFPLAAQFPIHFRKTYYPTCFHQNPKKEFDHHEQAARILGIAPPIGWTKTTFRSCFIPGVSYAKLSPFGVEPITQNLQLGTQVPTPQLIGLWDLLVRLYTQVQQLHQNDLVHGDLFLHNVLVSNSPIAVNLIDFELAKTREQVGSADDWEALKRQDLDEIWKHALFLQCALGPQDHPLAKESLTHAKAHFPDPGAVDRCLARATPNA